MKEQIMCNIYESNKGGNNNKTKKMPYVDGLGGTVPE